MSVAGAHPECRMQIDRFLNENQLGSIQLMKQNRLNGLAAGRNASGSCVPCKAILLECRYAATNSFVLFEENAVMTCRSKGPRSGKPRNSGAYNPESQKESHQR